MVDRAGRFLAADSARIVRELAKCSRFVFGAALLGVQLFAFSVDVSSASSEAVNKIARFNWSPELGTASRAKYLRAAIGINGQQAALWVAYVSALEGYRKAVRDAREEDVWRIFNREEHISMGPLEGHVSATKRDLRAKYRALYVALDQSQRRAADKTLTAGECGR
jgi:uncharacterized protein (DUF4213/DUF364 family)